MGKSISWEKSTQGPTLLLMNTHLFDNVLISEKTHHLQGANKVPAGTVWALLSCAVVILSARSAFAVTLEPPSNKWMVELPQEERQVA